VALLPYIGQKELFAEFRLDEPWDSPHNRRLLPRIPEIYQCPKAGPRGTTGDTFYQVLTGPDTPFAGKTGRGVGKFQDGLVNTLLIVEGGTAVPWTSPQDIPYDAGKPLPRLGGILKNGFNVLFADGTTRYLPRQTPEVYLRAVITPAGGEIVTEP
jgi:hypothetical protein